ncbi:hypothetical protein DIE18_15375 [Burkholderia sp. Bp9125]|nr:hypothetical protein DIE18_15375 [Burkholderia sp. Bp9125]
MTGKVLDGMALTGPLRTVETRAPSRQIATKSSFHLAGTFMRAAGEEVDFYSPAIFRHTFQMMWLIERCIDVDRCSAKSQCD